MSVSRKRLLIVGVVLVGLALNGACWFLFERAGDQGTLFAPTGIESNQLILVSGAADGGIFTASRANEVARYDGGLNAAATVLLEETIGGMAALPDGSVLVGTTTGEVLTITSALEPVESVPVDGRVLAIATSDDGFYVAHGIGAFGVRFFISYFAFDAEEPAVTWQVAQPVTSMTSWKDGVVFGTMNSNVGYFKASAPEDAVWMTQLDQPVSRVAAVPEIDRILVGSDAGTVTMLSADGAEAWTKSVGEYPVRGLAYDPETDGVLVGDAHGDLTDFDQAGTLVYQGSAGGESDLEGIVQTANEGWVVIPRSGEWQALDPASASSAASVSSIRLAWMIGNSVYVLLVAGAIVAVVEPWRVAVTTMFRRARRSWIAYVFVLPAAALIALFSYYPAVMALYYSFTSYSLRSVTEWVGFENYDRILFDDQYFRIGMKNMLIIAATSVIKTLTVPLLIAELIFWLRNSWHSYIFRTLFILPTVVPGLVFTLMWRQIYDPDTGMINELLGALGLEHVQTAWLGNPETALWAIIGVGFPWVDAFALLILLGGLLNINADYFDAAKVDGASVWQRFRHVDLPLLIPQFRILLFFAITGTVQGFVSIFILTRGGPGMTTYIPALQMYMRIADGDFGYASAVGVILFLIILVATFLVLRFRRSAGIEDA